MKAFSLIELLIVISIIAILVSFGIPALRNYKPNLELNGSVRELTSDIRYAQQLTVTEQIEYSVIFYTIERRYEIVKYGANTEIIKQVLLPKEIISLTITPLTNNEIRYNPYGAVAESGSITLMNTKNKTKTIDIRPSGFVKIIN